MSSLQKSYSKEKLTGQIFTPYHIVDKILDDTGYNNPDILGKKIIDPACGNGRFLLKIAMRIIRYSPRNLLAENLQNIYGWDIDETAVNQAINNLNQLIKPFDINVRWKISVADTLLYSALPVNEEKFDFVVGNPPYIRIQHLEEKQRKFIQNRYQFCKSGATDIYIAFYELALNLLKNSGKAGYITPNTFFHTDTAKTLRDYFATRQNLVQITNYGHIQLFEDATTYSAIVIFDKAQHKNFLYQQAQDQKHFEERRIDFSELKNRKFWQLSLKKRSLIQGKRLGDIAKIHVGITTLADKAYIMPLIRKEKNHFILQSKYDGIVQIEKGILKPIIKASTLKKSDEPIKEYILFPYRKVKGKHRIIPEHILKRKYPAAYEYLLKIKPILDKRDNGKPNPVSWYAFGRSQGLDTSFGEKILFSPMNKEPNFIFSPRKKATFYSGYCIKYDGNPEYLLNQLNSERMKEYIRISARDFQGGWKAYNKKIIQEFIIR